MVLLFGGIIRAFKKGVKSAKKITRAAIPVIKPLAPIAGGIFGGPAGVQTATQFVSTAERLAARTPSPARRLPVRRRVPTRRPTRILPRPRALAAIPRGPRVIGRGPARISVPAVVPTVTPIRLPPSPAVRKAIMPPRLVPKRLAAVAAPRRLPQAAIMLPRQIIPPVPRQLVPVGPGGAMIPGGAFGEITPISETVDKFGRHLVVEAKTEDRIRCPPGYLAITMPDGSRACALAGPAIAAGLARRRRKPLISVRETRALQLASRAQRKIDRVHKRFGSKTPMRRRRTSSSK